MALLIIRLTPAQRFIPAIAKLQRLLQFRAEDADIDPGVMLGVVPDTLDMSRLVSSFFSRSVKGQVERVTVQDYQGRNMTVVELSGDIVEIVNDFEQFSMVDDLGGASMALASKAVDPDVLDVLTQESMSTTIEFDCVEAVDLDTGRVVFSHELGEDTDNDDD